MNKIKFLAGCLCLLIGAYSFAQPITHEKEPEEYTFRREYTTLWKDVKKDVNVSWLSTNVRVEKQKPPVIKAIKTAKISAWKGEMINLQALIWTKKDLGEIQVRMETLAASNGSVIPAGNIRISAVRYVVTDELNKDKQGTCGYRPDPTLFDSLLVADVIDLKPYASIQANEVRPFWLKISIPQDSKTGVYKGEVSFGHPELSSLKLEVNVQDRVLPQPKDWEFHLDLWQNPFSVARYHQVPLWSDEHLELMRPVMKILADAGQKVITASIMHKPWNGQTYDYFESMVMRIKTLDGGWLYDYAVFDRWVEFMMSMGINQQINCYTLIPWDLSFQYFDQASNQLKMLKAEPGTTEFSDYWLPFLVDFSAHLRAKGWFEKTTIAMDERPMKQMQKVIELIRQADPKLKISLAGNYHAEIESDLYDYCIALDKTFPDDVLQRRKAEGKISTVYTCCTEPYPNTFTFSSPAESAWFGWYAANKKFDGYLRWAYNSWNKEPLIDTRFTAWGAGDCFFVYPDGRSSIRMEKLIEGIQDFEKIRMLRDQFEREKNFSKLKKIDEILLPFEVKKLDGTPASNLIEKARKALSEL